MKLKIDKNIIITAIISAMLGALAANTVRDASFIKNNGKIMKKLTSVVEVIKDKCIYEVDDEEFSDLLSTVAAESVKDPYTRYLNKFEYKQYIDSVSSSYVGIGVVLVTEPQSGNVGVLECVENGSAANAGIAPGDLFVKVDDIEVTGESLDKAIAYIKEQEPGTTVKVTVEREGNEMVFDVAVDTVQLVTVSGQMLEDNIGYIKIDNFEGTYDKEAKDSYDYFMEQVNTLRDEGMTKMIIELRNNPGGELGVVSAITDEFLDEGIITYTEDKQGKKEYLYAREGSISYPLVILTNGASASASEVFTGALKDNKRAKVVGEKTFGKGIVQTAYPFADGSGMSVTIARYYTPSGECIHDIGIEPDIECKLPEGKTIADYTIETDPQIRAAIEAFER